MQQCQLSDTTISPIQNLKMIESTTVPTTPVLTKHSKERRFLYSNHLSKEFLEPNDTSFESPYMELLESEKKLSVVSSSG